MSTAVRGPRETLSTPWSNVVVEAAITSRQTLYLLLAALSSLLVAGAINFGIHCAIYVGAEPPHLWEFPGNLAGDFAITLLATVLITYFLASLLHALDVRSQRINALSPGSAARWWPRSDNWCHDVTVTHEVLWPRVLPAPSPDGARQRHRLWLLSRALTLVAFMFIWYGIAVGITAAIWGNSNYNSFPQPELILAVFGGVCAALTSLFVAWATLVSIGERLELSRA